MMKRIVLLLAFIPSLQGCLYQTVDNVDIQRASIYCGGYEKIAEISSNFVGDEKAHCLDGRKIITDNVRVSK